MDTLIHSISLKSDAFPYRSPSPFSVLDHSSSEGVFRHLLAPRQEVVIGERIHVPHRHAESLGMTALAGVAHPRRTARNRVGRADSSGRNARGHDGTGSPPGRFTVPAARPDKTVRHRPHSESIVRWLGESGSSCIFHAAA